MRAMIIGLALALASPAALYAQSDAVAAPEPARLAAAQRVIEQVLPPSQRDAMMEQMIRPMMTNIAQGMQASPEFAELQRMDPKFQATMERFMADEQNRALENLRQSMPALSDAMARAYARRFDVQQLGEIEAFFATPTGRTYIQQSMTIMSDPDIGAVQRDMMTRSMQGTQERVAGLIANMAEDAEGAKP